MNDGTTMLSQQALSRLRWRCRRGLLENELIIHRWLDAHADGITVQQADALSAGARLRHALGWRCFRKPKPCDR